VSGATKDKIKAIIAMSDDDLLLVLNIQETWLVKILDPGLKLAILISFYFSYSTSRGVITKLIMLSVPVVLKTTTLSNYDEKDTVRDLY
jgi:hypothetical protein